jgi:hypothetical protein
VKIVRWVGIVFGAYVILALALDGMIAILQPMAGATGVLRTFDEQGRPHETVLSVIDDDGTLWVESGHHFRGWYHRLRRKPEVELVRDEGAQAYRAVALDTPEAEQRIKALMKARSGSIGYYVSRAMLLFAEIKPVRLDPRDER